MFSESYLELCANPLVAREQEPKPFSGPTPQKLREKLVASIWADQLLDLSRLQTADGKRVKVVSPGWHNEAAGPDFRRAEIEIDGKRCKGDVEIHTYAAHWYQHKHDADPAYDQVILHVVMWNNRTTPTTKTYSGSRIPILAMSRSLARPLAELEQEVGEAKVTDAEQARSVLTQERLAQITGPEFGAFLDAAGDWRVVRKAMRIQVGLAKDDPNDLFYRSVMEALGYSQNRRPFVRLAMLLPLKELTAFAQVGAEGDARAALFALLLQRADLVPPPSGRYDKETEQFVQALYARVRTVPQGRSLRGNNWTVKGVRPANYPVRRLAAAANFLANGSVARPLDSFEELLRVFALAEPNKKNSKKLLDAMIRRISDGPDQYFHTHYTIGGKPLGGRRDLIGRQRALVMVVNGVIPMLLALSRKRGDKAGEAALHRFYRVLPKLQDDRITKFVRTRLLTEPGQAAQVNTTQRQQALYQIYADLVLR